MAEAALLGTMLAGVALGLSLAAPPGPVAVLMVRGTSQGGWARGVRVSLGATTADACFLLLALLGALAVLRDRPTWLGAASLLGAAILLFFAYGSWKAARAPLGGAEEGGKRVGFVDGFLAAATSPFNLAWWVGPGTVLIASAGLGLVAGMFAGILAWVVLFCWAVAKLGQRVRGFQRYVAYASAVVLAAFAAWVGLRGAGLLGLA